MAVENVYFELTRAFNAHGPIAVLASGQAVVYYRISMASKDGDWILREEQPACARVLEVLAARGATYRPGAPLDVRWLRGGWSSHIEYLDARRRRIRCDFFTRPPRVPLADVERLFAAASDPLLVIDLESLVRMKQTQRPKDYAVIGEVARLLPPERELELTTDPDRLLALAAASPATSSRPAVVAARRGAGGEQVEVELVREARQQREADARRMRRYATAAEGYLTELLAAGLDRDPLATAHPRLVALAERSLPREPPKEGDDRADAE